MKLNLYKNSIFNTVSFLFSAGLWIILVPFVISHIGLSNYGLWAIGSIIISTASYLNLGLPIALTRATTEAISQKNGWLLHWLLMITDLIFLLISIIILVILVLYGEVIIREVFGIDDISEGHLLSLLLPAMVPVSLIFMMGLSRKAIMDGFQEVHLTSKITMVGRFVNFCATIIFILAGQEIWSLYIAAALENGLILILYHVLSQRHVHTLDLSMIEGIHPWRQLKIKLSYGINLQISNLVAYGIELLYKSIVSSRLGVATLGEFQIVWRAIQMLQGLLTSMIRPIFAASSLLSDQNDRQRLWFIFEKASYYAMFLAIVVFAIVIPFSSLIFNIWIGQTSVFQVGTFQIMCIWVAFSTLASPGYLFLLGKGNSKAILVIQAASSLAAVIIMIIPIGLMRNYPWEFIGFSYAIFGIISFTATLLYTNRNFGWSIYKMLKVILPTKLTIVGICLSILVFILAAAQAESRLYQALLFTFTGFCLIGLLLYTMPIEEKNIIRKYILHLRKSA